MYEWADDDDVRGQHPLVVSRRAHREQPTAGIHRPRGEWIVAALHGRGAPAAEQPPAEPADAADEADAPPDASSHTPTGTPTSTDAPPGASAATCSETAFDVSSDALAAAEAETRTDLDPRARLLEEGAGWLDAAVEIERGLAQLAGARARALAGFARCRPSSWDRQPGEVGAASAASRAARPQALTEVSEWAVDEVAARLRLPSRTASELLVDCVELVEQLPATLAALEAGNISWAHARALVELLRSVSDAEKKQAVQARVLPRAGRQTVAQLRECTRRAIARIDADAALRRLVTAVAGRKVTRHAGEDGMAVLTALLPGPVARACQQALRAYAQACAVDQNGEPDPRSLDQRMADCLADLILRPDAAGRSPVQVLLTVIATAATLTGTGPGADEPGEVDGEMVPAPLIRELAHALGLMPRPNTDQTPTTDQTAQTAQTAQTEDAAPAGDAEDQGGERAVEEAAPADDPAAARERGSARRADAEAGAGAQSQSQSQSEALAALLDLRKIADTALAERPRIAIVDELTGCLLALTDSIELTRAARTGHGLGPPPETDDYRPSTPLDRFVRLRDRRCRFPGCRNRRLHLDHLVPYPAGPTAHTNLDGLCEHHHRLSHQAPGWQLSGSPIDGLIWTLPGGTTITTVPPHFGTDDGTTPHPHTPWDGDADGSVPDASTATAGPAEPRWSQLTDDQRRERIRALLDPHPTDEQRADDGPAPF